MKPLLVLFTILALAGVADAQEKAPEYLIGSWSGKIFRGPEEHSVTVVFKDDGAWNSAVEVSGGGGRTPGIVFADGKFRVEPSGEVVLDGRNTSDTVLARPTVGHRVGYRLKRVEDGKLAGKFISGAGGEYETTLTKGK